jgi:hypothetical protein
MDSGSTLTIGALVTIATQLIKQVGVPARFAPLVVLGVALVIVAAGAYAAGDFSRATSLHYLGEWLTDAMTAIGMYEGVSRGASALTKS